MDEKLRETLKDDLQYEIDNLSELLQRDLSTWLY